MSKQSRGFLSHLQLAWEDFRSVELLVCMYSPPFLVLTKGCYIQGNWIWLHGLHVKHNENYANQAHELEYYLSNFFPVNCLTIECIVPRSAPGTVNQACYGGSRVQLIPKYSGTPFGTGTWHAETGEWWKFQLPRAFPGQGSGAGKGVGDLCPWMSWFCSRLGPLVSGNLSFTRKLLGFFNTWKHCVFMVYCCLKVSVHQKCLNTKTGLQDCCDPLIWLDLAASQPNKESECACIWGREDRKWCQRDHNQIHHVPF